MSDLVHTRQIENHETMSYCSMKYSCLTSRCKMRYKMCSRYTAALATFVVLCYLLCYLSYWQLYSSITFLQSPTSVLKTPTTKQVLAVEPSNASIARTLLPERKPRNISFPTVIILTMRRSGSSIFGSIFNQKDSAAFYLYEPLFPFDELCEEFERIEVLKHISRCEFEEIQPLYKKGFARTNRVDRFAKCQRNNICFADVAKKVSDFLPIKACKDNVTQKNCTRGGPIDLNKLSYNCSKNSVIVLKLVYFCKLEWLMPLLEDPAFDIRIIHLVRDPRATVKSRAAPRFLRASAVRKHAKSICGQLIPNLKYADEVLNKSLSREKYLRIRYEDFAWKPVEMARKVYEFVGIQITDNVEKWLWKATAPSNHKNWSKLSVHGLRRNARHVISAWRTELSFYKVYEIQKACSKAINQLGYKIYRTEQDLRDKNKLHFKPKIWF